MTNLISNSLKEESSHSFKIGDDKIKKAKGKEFKITFEFNENGKSFDEIVITTLKTELRKKFNITCNFSKMELPCICTHYSQNERSENNC